MEKTAIIFAPSGEVGGLEPRRMGPVLYMDRRLWKHADGTTTLDDIRVALKDPGITENDIVVRQADFERGTPNSFGRELSEQWGEGIVPRAIVVSTRTKTKTDDGHTIWCGVNFDAMKELADVLRAPLAQLGTGLYYDPDHPDITEPPAIVTMK